MQTGASMANRFGGFATYAEYLKSPHWKRMRKHFCGKRRFCYACQEADRLQIHHIHYSRLGAEEPRDIIVLCRRCHQQLHLFLDAKFPGEKKAFKARKTQQVFEEVFQITLESARERASHREVYAALFAPSVTVTVQTPAGSTANSIAEINIRIKAHLYSKPPKIGQKKDRKKHRKGWRKCKVGGKKSGKNPNKGKLKKSEQQCNCGLRRPKPTSGSPSRFDCAKCVSRREQRIIAAEKNPFTGKCFACGKKNVPVTSTSGKQSGSGLCQKCRAYSTKTPAV